jgi:hypothetical protein
MWATSANKKNYQKVNNQPLGENSPNVVTLFAVQPGKNAFQSENFERKNSGLGNVKL